MVSVSVAGLTQRVNLYSRLPGALGPSSSPRRGLGAPFFVANLGTSMDISCGCIWGCVPNSVRHKFCS